MGAAGRDQQTREAGPDSTGLAWTPPALADEDWMEPEGREAVQRFADFMQAQPEVLTEALVSYEALRESGQKLHLVYLKSGKRKRTYTRTFHDFRRTAARNLVRSGLARSQAKAFTGHITDSVFDRYGIDDAASKKDAAENYAAHMETQRPT